MGRGRKRGCKELILTVYLPAGMDDSTCPQEAFERFYEEQLWRHISAYSPKVQLAMLAEMKKKGKI